MAKLNERYAHALVELAEEAANLETGLKQAILIKDMLKKADVQAFLTHPHISNTAKNELFERAFSDNFSEYLIGFLYLMVQQSRELLIVPVLTEFIERVKRRLGKTEARVVSASPLKEQQMQSIRTLLSKKINMEIEIIEEIDPDVIGGFYILVDGQIFDGTIRSRLNVMRDRIKRGGYQ